MIPLITSFTPQLKLLSEAFTWLYNWVLLPMGNALIVLFVGFKNAITGVVNGIIALVNLLPWNHFDYLNFDNVDDYMLKEIKAENLTTSSSSSTSGSSASYTAARDYLCKYQF